MGADRRNYAMSVEVAMAREMAYRKKLETMTSQGSSHSGITACSISSFPLQVPSPTSNETPRPRLEPCVNSSLHSTIGLTANQMTGFPGSTLLPRPPFPRASSSSGSIWNPTQSADQKLRPTPIWNPMLSADPKRKGPSPCDQPAQLGRFFCLLCQIDCTTSYNLMMHYQGQRHKAKLLGEPKGKQVASVSRLSTASERIYCKFCGIWCKDEYTFKLHLQCKNHILKLDHERKMRRLV